MSTYDLSSLAPSDAEVALRSFPRRFREALVPLGEDERTDEVATRRPPGGASVLDLLGGLLDRWDVQRDALRRLLVDDAPELPAATVHPVGPASAPAPGATMPGNLDLALGGISDAAMEFADAVAATPAGGWTRSGTTEGAQEVSALDVAREAVRAGRDTLDEVQRTLAAVRRE